MSIPTWPEGLNHMPEQGGWTFKPIVQSARTDFDAGPSRVRRRFTRSSSEQEVSLVMNHLEFETFKAFVDLELRGASRWFMLPLFQGSIYGQYEARLKDAETPYQATYRGFNTVNVSFTLETRENTLVFDAGVLYMLSLWGPEYSIEFSDQLQVLVNETYPAIWANTDY